MLPSNEGVGPDTSKRLHEISRMATPSATLTAPINTGTLQFHIDKNIGGNCPLSGFSLTPFTVNQLAGEWKDACGGGQLILTKTR